MESQQVFLLPQVPQLPPASNKVHHHHHQQQTTTHMFQQQPQQPQCSICGTTQKLLRCAKCKAIYYCSTDHQHLDWPTHKQECRTLAKQRQINNRLQQLTNGCGAININAHSNSPNTCSISTSNYALCYSTPPPTAPAFDNIQQHQESKQIGGSFLLGTQENEILNSKAEIVLHQNSNKSDFVCSSSSSFDNHFTTTDQMHNIILENGLDYAHTLGDNSQQFNDNSHYYQTDNETVLKNTLSNATEQAQYSQVADCSLTSTAYDHLPGQSLVEPPNSIQQQQQQQQQQSPASTQQQHQQLYMPPAQATLQYPVPQLSNYLVNQHEKSSSYQIGAAVVDENPFENANERRYEELCRNIINDMNQYGLSVVDDFLGREKGLQILNEVHKMYSAGMFKDGQLVNNMKSEQDLRTIRGDKITWVKGVEQGCSNVGYLINQIDAVICRANTMRNNGKLGNYAIKERTKAMVACYPGSGSHYVMHVDNPNKDGRVITAIYYLNLNWDSRNSGGVLRIFPEQTKSVADIEPKFDRLIFFWSDKRNPHEVQPAHRTRYAITVWYFDANEREQALNRCKSSQNSNKANSSASASATTAATSQPNSNTTSNSISATDAATTNTTSSESFEKSPASQSSSTTNSSLPSSSSMPQSATPPSRNIESSSNPATTLISKPVQVVRPNSYK